MQLDVIDSKSEIIKQAGAEGVTPVHNRILDRCIRETRADQLEGIDFGIVLLGVRIATKNVVLTRCIVVDFDVVLVAVEQLGRRITRVVLQTSTSCGWVK